MTDPVVVTKQNEPDEEVTLHTLKRDIDNLRDELLTGFDARELTKAVRGLSTETGLLTAVTEKVNNLDRRQDFERSDSLRARRKAARGIWAIVILVVFYISYTQVQRTQTCIVRNADNQALVQFIDESFPPERELPTGLDRQTIDNLVNDYGQVQCSFFANPFKQAKK